jgi:hypothetical protein
MLSAHPKNNFLTPPLFLRTRNLYDDCDLPWGFGRIQIFCPIFCVPFYTSQS